MTTTKYNSSFDIWQSFSHIDQVVSFLVSIEVNIFRFFEKMKKSEFHVVIKHLHLKGLTPKKIKTELYAVHGESALVFATVYN